MEFSHSVFGLPKIIEKLRMKKSVLDDIKSHIRDEYPVEAVGILVGYILGEVAYVEKNARLRNILGSSHRFWFNEVEWMEKILNYRRDGYEYIGIYHSHSFGEPIPSISDQERMIECPGEIWFIVSYKPDNFLKYSAWKLDEQGHGLAKVETRIYCKY